MTYSILRKPKSLHEVRSRIEALRRGFFVYAGTVILLGCIAAVELLVWGHCGNGLLASTAFGFASLGVGMTLVWAMVGRAEQQWRAAPPPGFDLTASDPGAARHLKRRVRLMAVVLASISLPWTHFLNSEAAPSACTTATLVSPLVGAAALLALLVLALRSRINAPPSAS